MPAYPTFTSNVVVQRPWGYRRRFCNLHSEMPHGWRYSYNLRATPLMTFLLEYPSFSDADVVTLRDFYIARQGGWENFDFTDPETSTVYTKCRFAGDSFDVRHINYNLNAVSVVIEEHA